MKLWELREVPFRRAWKTPKEVQEWLKENGYEYIGAGVYSDVFGKDEYVIKVHAARNIGNVTAKCLIAYSRLSMRSNNPHFPKIHAIKTFRGEEHSVTHYIIGTERLYPIEKDKIKIPKNVDEQEFFSFLAAIFHLWSLSPIDISTDTTRVSEIRAMAERYLKKNSKNDPLIQAYNLVKKVRDRYTSCFLDFSESNVMMRKDGTIVISDPIGDRSR